MSCRVWRTADGRYVGDGHLDAEILAAGTGDPRPDDFDAKTFELGPTPADWAEEVEPEAEAEAEAEEVEPEKASTISVGKPAAKPTAKRK